MPNPPAAPAGCPPPVSDHGGNLGAARQRFPDAPQPWIDLSTGINPWPYPFPPPPPESWQRLPETLALEALAAAAARTYGVPGPDHVAAAPGSQALIQWLPRLVPSGRVAVLTPTYAEHAAAWAAAGHAVTAVTDPEALYHESWDTVVVVDPNNPDGRRLATGRLATLADGLGRRGGRLVVDQAFADTLTDPGIAARVGQPGLVVLRSFGKFFGLAGVRLGFALAEPAMIGRWRTALGPWPVSGPAVTIAQAALSDHAWIAATRTRLTAAAARLDRLLEDRGLGVIGGTPLFRLAATDAAAEIFQRLAAGGLLVRRFDAHPGWLRFGLPGDETSWRRLGQLLSRTIG